MMYCPCTRAAYIALTVLLGFAAAMILHSTGEADSVSAPRPSKVPQTVIVDPNGSLRVASQPAATKPKPPKVYINFALASNGATVLGGKNSKLLIDGNETDYTGSTGFAMTHWNNNPPQFLIVTLKDSTQVGCVKFLLWDRSDERFYRYKLDISASENGEDWKTVADRSDPAAECKSWQVVSFAPQTVRRIRLTGTYNSANAGFHVVELQAFVEAPPPSRKAESEPMDF
jgi:F5/8 type C domain